MQYEQRYDKKIVLKDHEKRAAKILAKDKRILDACCGGRMFWFQKYREDVLYTDIRRGHYDCSDRVLDINPDIIVDFRDMPFCDETFYMVVFDPPHLEHLGNNSDYAKKYGRLFPSWEDDICEGFSECFRVLKKNGTLIFKWNEYDIATRRIIEIIGKEPLFGHKSGKQAKTHWMTFMK